MTARETTRFLRQWAWQYEKQRVICLLKQKMRGLCYSSHGRPKMIGYLADTVTNKVMDSWWRALIWRERGSMQCEMDPPLIGALLVAWSLSDCCSGWTGILRWFTVSCWIKFPAEPESIKQFKTWIFELEWGKIHDLVMANCLLICPFLLESAIINLSSSSAVTLPASWVFLRTYPHWGSTVQIYTVQVILSTEAIVRPGPKPA